MALLWDCDLSKVTVDVEFVIMSILMGLFFNFLGVIVIMLFWNKEMYSLTEREI